MAFDVYAASLLGLGAVLLLLLIARRLVFSWSTIGAFLVSNLAFVTVGVLALPWVRDHLSIWFVRFDMHLVTDAAMVRAILLSVGGVWLAFAGYQVAHLVISQGKILTAGPRLLQAHPDMPAGLRWRRLVFVAVAVLAVGWMFMLLNASTITRGIIDGWIRGQPGEALEARRGTANNYLFVVLVYNVAPFVTVALWMLARRARGASGQGLRLLAWVAVASTSLFLLAMFQKRPLLIFLMALAIGHFAVRVRVERPRRLRGLLRAGVVGVVLFALLMGLYYATTNVREVTSNPVETAAVVASAASQRVFGRLALPAAMYAYLFPEVVPHYGVRNIGMLASLADTDPYLDTREVYGYFANARTPGSVASSALLDFYGAFGWVGWGFGSVGIGMLLYALDRFLRRLRPTIANHTLVIFAFVFAYYLSQASLARSLMGYGGLFFLGTWMVLRVRGDVAHGVRRS